MKFTGAANEAPSLSLASAATVNIGAAGANTITITGTTTITAFDTILAGARRILIFPSVLTLTYNATSMQLITAANIVTAAGDSTEVESLGGGNWLMLSYTRATGTALVSSGGGALADFTDSLNTSTPNATIPVAAISATNAATNVDIALVPKGTGAITAQIADNTTTGGNKRGANAVDLQTSRTLATQVASGNYSFITGYKNLASGLYSSAIGYTNISSGQGAVAYGYVNTASATAAVAIGSNCSASSANAISIGAYNTATASAAVALGYSCTASGANSLALGSYSSTRGVTGALAWSSLPAASGGVVQTEQFLLRMDTVDATPTRVTTDGLAASATNGPILPNTSSYWCRIRVLARNTTNGDSSSWTTSALIHREANAASTVLIGSPAITLGFQSSSLSSCVVAVTADTTLGGLAITVTGIAATNIRWVAHVETLEATN